MMQACIISSASSPGTVSTDTAGPLFQCLKLWYHRSTISQVELKLPKSLTFTNNDTEDLDVLYVDLERDEDNAELEQAVF